MKKQLSKRILSCVLNTIALRIFHYKEFVPDAAKTYLNGPKRKLLQSLWIASTDERTVDVHRRNSLDLQIETDGQPVANFRKRNFKKDNTRENLLLRMRLEEVHPGIIANS